MRWWGLGILASFMVLTASGCGPRASAGGFDSANPAARLYAIQQAAKARDRSAIPRLIEQLDSDDPAICLWAIYALETITGERMGYNPYASAEIRKPAIDTWAAAARNGTFNP